MKVLFILNSGFDVAGPSNHLLESIIEKLLLEGKYVHIIQKTKSEKNNSLPLSIRGYSNLTTDVIQVRKIEKSSFSKRYLEDLLYAFTCTKYYRKQKDSNVVFLQSCNTAFFHLLLLKILLKKPVLFNVQDIFPKNAIEIGMLKKNSMTYKVLNFLQKSAYRMSDRIITISEDMKKTLINDSIKENKIEVVHNWSYSDEVIDINIKDNRFIQENLIEDKSFKVVYAGNIGALQNVEVILEAANLLKNNTEITFYIIGDGVKKDQCIEYARVNGLKNVVFFPMQDSQYAPHIYSMADVNVIPLNQGIISTALPSKTATCLSCGKPIIACVGRETGFNDLMKQSDAITVIDSNDSKGLAESIERNYRKKDKNTAGSIRKIFSKYFSKKKNTDRYTKTIEQLSQ